MNRDPQDPGGENEGDDATAGSGEKQTVPPPALFNPMDDEDERTVMAAAPDPSLVERMRAANKATAARTSSQAGLRQMFSRDPSHVRQSLPSEGESDALLQMLFEDANDGEGERQSAPEPHARQAPPPPPSRAAPPRPPEARPRPPLQRPAAGLPPEPAAPKSVPPPLPKASPPARPPAPPVPPARAANRPPPPTPPTPQAPPVRHDVLDEPDADEGEGEGETDMTLAMERPSFLEPTEEDLPLQEESLAAPRKPAESEPTEADASDFEDVDPPPQRVSTSAIPARPAENLSFAGEEDASAQLGEERDAWAERAAWLRDEAHANDDRAARARGLLVVSELFAMVGDGGNALAVAVEARDLLPTAPLTHRQVRGLSARHQDWSEVLESLDAEGKAQPTPAARAHAAIFAAEVARVGLNDEEAGKRRLEIAQRLAPSDPRSHFHKIASALASPDGGDGSPLLKLRLPEGRELQPLANALTKLQTIRGVAPKDAPATSAYEALLQVRIALEAGQAEEAVTALGPLFAAEGIGAGASLLGASLAAPHRATRSRAVEQLRAVIDGPHASLVRRALAGRAIELGDAAAARAATEAVGSEAFSAADRVALAAFSGGSRVDVEEWLDALLGDEELAPIAVAVSAALEPASKDGDALPAIGSAQSKAAHALGRALASGAEAALVTAHGQYEGAIPESPIARALGLEIDLDARAGGRVAQAIAAWRDDADTEKDRALASALIAEVSGETERAKEAFEKLRRAEPGVEAVARACISQASPAEAAEILTEHAQALEAGSRAAILLTEAAIRVAEADADQAEGLLRRATQMDPKLPLPHHLAERSARTRGDRDGLVEWLRLRREASDDVVEQAHDLVREALLLSDADGSPATAILEQALRARPTDVGLRELYERLSAEPPPDRATWRAARAAELTGLEAGRLAMEAAVDFERVGDWVQVAQMAELAMKCGESSLAPMAAYRAALNGQGAGEIIDALLPTARETEDPLARLEIYERLAELDERGRRDAGSGLLWRRSILEETPGHLPTLRRVANTLLGAGRDDELEPVVLEIARALDGQEAIAHAMLSSRLRIRATGWDDTLESVEIAYKCMPRTLWSLRQMAAHARARNNHELALEADRQLIERTQRPSEAATLALRAAQSGIRAGHIEDALAFLAHAIELVPNHLVAHLELAATLEQTGNFGGAAASLEAASVVTSSAPERIESLYRAAQLWQDKVNDNERAKAALEAVVEIDPSYKDVFDRLQALYVASGARAELAELLKRRLDAVTDPAERIEMEVLRGRALADVGDAASAKRALATALEANPDHVEALSAFGDVSSAEGDWTAAEQAWIRLARLIPDPERQTSIYLRLGELYDEHVPNPERAELAYNEILKRVPGDTRARERLVALFQRQNDAPRAIEQQTILINAAESPEDKCQRTTELARIYEAAGDGKKAEATLLQARKTWPKDDVALAALARFYQRNNQAPAAQVLLDRSVADARRALGTGRFESYLFTTIATVASLRNRPDAARVAQCAVATLEGETAELDGAGARAGDPRLDDFIAPEVVTPSFRELLRRTGQLLDAAMPFDLASIRATPLPPQQGELTNLVRMLGAGYGLPAMNVYTSNALGQVCVPVSAYPPAVVLGQGLVANPREDVRAFLIHRALKILQTNASALSRTAPIDLWPLLGAYLKVMNPNWAPQGIDQAKLTDFYGRVSRALQGALDPQLALLASEVVGTIGNRASTLNTAINGWGNRAALLATGDLNVALAGIAWSGGHGAGPPLTGKERLTWIGRNAEARELVVFAVSDGFADARARLGLGV